MLIKVLESDSVEKVIKVMGANKETRTVFVVDEAGSLKGIISIQDLFNHLFDEMKPPIVKWFHKKKNLCARDIMGPPIIVSLDDDLEDALRAATVTKVQDLPVCKDEKIVAELDCFELLYGLVEKDSKYFKEQ